MNCPSTRDERDLRDVSGLLRARPCTVAARCCGLAPRLEATGASGSLRCFGSAFRACDDKSASLNLSAVFQHIKCPIACTELCMEVRITADCAACQVGDCQRGLADDIETRYRQLLHVARDSYWAICTSLGLSLSVNSFSHVRCLD